MLERIARDRVATLFLVTVAVLLLVGLAAPGFLSAGTATIIWSNGLVPMLVALGIFPILTQYRCLGRFNLGLGGGAGLGAYYGFALPLALGFALGPDLCRGCEWPAGGGLGVPSIVATLGTLGLFRGVMLITTGGEWIEELPSAYLWRKVLWRAVHHGAHHNAGDRGGLVVSAQQARALGDVTGDNRSRRHLGLPVRIELFGYLGGAMYALAGITFAAQIGFVPNQAGNGIELRAIAALVLGGISLLGGVGSVGSGHRRDLFHLDRHLVFLKIPAYWNDPIGGAMLLGVLLIDGRLRIALEARDRAARYRRSSQAEQKSHPLEDAA